MKISITELKDITQAVPKSKVSGDYYETHDDLSHIPTRFNEPIHLHHVPEFEEEALKVIREWEAKMKG